MSSIEADIEEALFARVRTLVLTPAMPIAWPNKAFTPPSAGYLEVTHIPNGTRRMYTSGADPHQLLGLLQIDIMKPLGSGSDISTEVAGAIVAHFPADQIMTAGAVRVRVQRRPEKGSARRDDPYWMTPITVLYEVLV